MLFDIYGYVLRFLWPLGFWIAKELCADIFFDEWEFAWMQLIAICGIIKICFAQNN